MHYRFVCNDNYIISILMGNVCCVRKDDVYIIDDIEDIDDIDVEDVEFLIKNKLNVNKKGMYGSSYLHYACYNGKYDAAKLLIMNGADINIEDSVMETPLQAACLTGHYDIVELLISHGANIDNDIFIQSPLYSAYLIGRIDIAKLLMDYGVNTNVIYNNRETIMRISQKDEYDIFASMFNKEMKKRVYILSLIINFDITKYHIVRKINLL